MSKLKFTPPLDASGLTQEELDAARERARKKLADEVAYAELGLAPPAGVQVRKGPIPMPEEEFLPIYIDLYEGSDRITIDGQTFLHNHTYEVPKRTYDTLSEIISRGWAHQREIEGKDSNAYRKQQNINAITGAPTFVPASVARRLG